MKETTIYLVRHAEAEGNLYRRIHGQYDSNVTMNGLRQIAALEERFRGISVDAVYASDLTRTCRTARAVADQNQLEIRTDARFREVALGVWEDAPFGELDQENPVQMRNFNYAPQKWKVEGAESWETYTSRFLDGLQAVADMHPGETVAIVSHGSVLSHSLKRLFPEAEMCHMDNTSVSRVRYDGSFHLDFLGDNSHLSEGISTLARQNWWRGDKNKKDRNLWFLPFESEIEWYLSLTDDSIPVAPMAIIDFAMLGRDAVGLLQLDPQRDQDDKAGFIDYVGLKKSHRGQGLGIQIIGAAVSYYRRLGRETLRVSLPQQFASCRGWFEHYGFRPIGDDIYELDIRVPNGL